jgi:HAD superfamily hydrolase (TIGR01509 family)
VSARIEALIFDLDGVLVDSEPVHYAASLRLVAPHHIEPEEYARFTGVAIRPYFEWITSRFDLGLTIDEGVERYTRLVTEELERTALQPLDGARELIAAAREADLVVGLASQSVSEWVEGTLRSAHLGSLFDARATGEEVERGKPAPDLFLLVAERLGVKPEACAAIEDSPAGVQSAAAAEMLVVQSRQASSAAAPQPAAHLVVTSLREVDLDRLPERAAR